MEWRTIDSAPKDGSYFLASNPAAGGAWVAHWHPVAVSGYKFADPWQSVMLNHWHLPKDGRYLRATHWAPFHHHRSPPPMTDAFITADMLARATMEPWESAMAEKGICPKCSDSLKRASEGDGLRFMQCMGCRDVFVVSAAAALATEPQGKE